MRARALGFLSLGLAGVACSSSSSSPSISPAERQAFSYVTNIIPVAIGVDGTPGIGYVDTGDPLSLLDPTVFSAAASLSANGGDVASMSIGSESPSNFFAIPTTSGLASPDPSFPLDANVGYSVIGGYVATFNYRDVAFGLATAAPTPPANLEPETVLGFAFEGGESLGGITIPRSRVVVTVSIEGTDYRMIVDSGASYVTVSQTAYTALTADGRAQLDGGSAETTSGTSSTSLARAKSLVLGGVGGVEVDSVVVSHDSSFDTNLASISTDAGETIDGSLGGTFLHDFYVTIDYPNSKLHLARYADLGFAIDPAERIGIGLALEGSTYSVASVTTAAAARGISPGAVVSAVDGVSLGGLPLSQAGALLFGAVGATKQVTLGTNTVSLAVEEMLPTTASSQSVGLGAQLRDDIVRRTLTLRRTRAL